MSAAETSWKLLGEKGMQAVKSFSPDGLGTQSSLVQTQLLERCKGVSKLKD